MRFRQAKKIMAALNSDERWERYTPDQYRRANVVMNRMREVREWLDEALGDVRQGIEAVARAVAAVEALPAAATTRRGR